MNDKPRHTMRDDLAPETVTRFLELGVERREDSLSPLVSRLLRSDGQRWMQQALSRSPIGSVGSPRAQLCEGGATLEQLESVKDACKKAMRSGGAANDARSRGRDAQLAAMLGYLAAIAAALHHYGVRLTSRPRAELDPMLLDLAEVTPRAWSDLFSRAAMAVEKKAER